MTQRVLILGADGFIGRHLAFGLRRAGYSVTASARRPARLKRMGFDVLAADLTDPATHHPAFWRPHLAQGAHLVNAAGLLTGSEAEFEAVHVAAPRAAYAALEEGARAVLISAVGIEATETRFARWRLAGEAAAPGVTVLRSGLALGDTSYGGSSLLRALAVLPFRTPVVGTGAEEFNPIHVDDLAGVVGDVLKASPGPGLWEIGGPERITQGALIAGYRAWFGLPVQPVLRLPFGLARLLGRAGDALHLGPISATAVAQMTHGVLAEPEPLLQAIQSRPRAVSEFLRARPAGTQDLWQARLYLLKPLVRLTLALLWLASGLIGLFLSASEFVPLLSGTGLPEATLTSLARVGGIVDLALGFALLRNWRPKVIGISQLAVVAGYTIALTALSPSLWLAPFGEVMKNLPILALIVVHLALVEER